jgi:hypothetical protein
VSAEEDVLLLHRLDERLGNLDRGAAKGDSFLVQLDRAGGDLLAHELLDAPLVDAEPALVERAVNRLLELVDVERLD